MAQIPSTMNIDIDNNIDREKSTSSSRNRFIKLSVLSNASSVAYHEWMEVINNLLSDEAQALVNSWQLLYASNYLEVEKDK